MALESCVEGETQQRRDWGRGVRNALSNPEFPKNVILSCRFTDDR